MSGEDRMTALFNYIASMDEVPEFHTEVPELSNLKFDPHELPVRDIRRGSAPSLEREGFLHARLSFSAGPETSPAELDGRLAPLLIDYFTAMTGAPKVIMTPPLVRMSDRNGRNEVVNSIPARYVHVDYNQSEFHRLASNLIADDPDRDYWLSGRYATYNTWRVLSDPPQDMPLAVVDRSTLAPEDLISGRTIIGRGDDAMIFGHGMVRYNPNHRWCYISDMTKEDMLVFVGFDSADDGLPGNPHSSFDNIAAGDRAVRRVSCEMRAMVFWGPETGNV